jgi:hypothetical protein
VPDGVQQVKATLADLAIDALVLIGYASGCSDGTGGYGGWADSAMPG